MWPGPKPKPRELRLWEGKPGHRPIPPPLEIGPPGAPPMPSGLPPDAAALWEEVVPVLERVKILNPVLDRAALTVFVLAWQYLLDAAATVEQEGPVALGSMGQVAQHPAVAMFRSYATVVLRYATEFGLAPSMRARVTAITTGKPGLEATLDAILSAPPTELSVAED